LSPTSFFLAVAEGCCPACKYSLHWPGGKIITNVPLRLNIDRASSCQLHFTEDGMDYNSFLFSGLVLGKLVCFQLSLNQNNRSKQNQDS
jgi:hypothetical protein